MFGILLKYEILLFFEMNDRCKVSCAKIIFLADLLGSQYFFKKLQISLTVKYSENVAKNGSFKKLL